MKPRILLTTTSFQETPGEHHAALAATGWEIVTARGPLSEADTLALVGDVDGYICGDDVITRAVLAKATPRLKVLSKYGIGVDKIDVPACTELGIPLLFTPGVNHTTVAEHTFLLLLALEKSLLFHTDSTRSGGWKRQTGHELLEKTIGIVGMGRIGSAVAARAKTFGLNIHYFSRNRRPPALEDKLGAIFHDTLDEMAGTVDILSLHTPLTRDTQHILSRERIGRMKPEAFVVNVSRSELIDEPALVEAIEAGRLSGAALDVFENRNGISPQLLDLARHHKIVLTAHMASATLEARLEMGDTVIVNIRTFMDGHQPPHRVLPDGRR